MMNQIWNRFPFVRILIPFILGILLYGKWSFPFQISIWNSILVFCFLLFSFFVFSLYKRIPYRYRLIAGILSVLMLFLSGFLVSSQKDLQKRHDFVEQFRSDSAQLMLVTVINQPVESKSSFKTTVKVDQIFSENQWHDCSGKAVFYFAKDSSSSNIVYGDRVLVCAKLNTIQAPILDSDFDYRQFLAGKNVFHQAYIQSGFQKQTGEWNGNVILDLALKCRLELLEILRNGLGEGDEFAVASAILAGERSELSAELMRSYAGSGAMHIMSVSGLHVGVVFIMLGFILNLFPYFRKRKWIRAILILLFIWAYAFITGLSASVLRSAFMISFLIIGESINRRVNSFNSLAASAFILLLFNPLLIVDIGFQLSYVAVAGIIALYGPIYKSVYVRKGFLDKIWQILAVSLAAQIATFPLSLYYFGQFPVYFLLTNLIVVPLSGFIIYAGTASLVLWQIPLLRPLTSEILSWLIQSMNWTVTTIESWPGSVLKGLYIGLGSLFLLYLIVFFSAFALRKSSPRLFIFALISTIVFLSIQLYAESQRVNSKDFFLLRAGKEYVIGLNLGSELHLWSSNNEPLADAYASRRIEQYMLYHSLNSAPVFHNYDTIIRSNSFFFRNGFFQYGDFKAYWFRDRKATYLTHTVPKINIFIAPMLYENQLQNILKQSREANIIYGGYEKILPQNNRVLYAREFCLKID